MSQEQSRGNKRDEEEVEATTPKVDEEAKAKLDDEVDGLLDEIDGVLEENSEEFVKGYVQKGGE